MITLYFYLSKIYWRNALLTTSASDKTWKTFEEYLWQALCVSPWQLRGICLLNAQLSAPQLLTCRVLRLILQDLSPSLLLSVNQPWELLSSIQKPHCGLGGGWWWAKEQRLVLWRALRGAMETLQAQRSVTPNIESRVSESSEPQGHAAERRAGL